MNFCNFSKLTALLKISTGYIPMSMYFRLTSSWLTKSLIKWCQSSICLDLAWNARFLVNAIAKILSQKISVAPICLVWRSFGILLNHSASQAASVAVIYSASVEDNEIILCFFVLQKIRFQPREKTYLEVLFLSSYDPAQSQPLRLKFISFS